MRPFELPRNLIASIDGDDPHCEELAAWAAVLPQTLAQAAARWSLDVGPPFQPGGAGSYVVPARTAGGARVVLKLGRQHDEARDEAEGLRLWDGAGAVRLLDSALDGSTSALLLEACEPGTPLSQLAGPAEQDEIIAGLLRRLWIEPPPGHGFRPLSEMCAAWAAELEQRFGPASCPGVDLFRRLPASGSGSRTVLLCTDLHHGNVLAAAREPWLMIDPKPYVGDPAYDALQHMINFPDRLAADPVAFTERMAGLLDLDAGRLLEWVYARCAIESPTWPELTPVVERLAGSLR